MRISPRLLIALSLLAAALLVILWPRLQGSVASRPDAIESLFAASFVDAKGKPQALKQWRGQVLVVNFWATWCPPCREEMPELAALHDKYLARGVSVIGISTDDAEKMQAFAANSSISYPLLAGDFEGMNLAESLGDDRSILPYTVVVGRDGNLVYTHFGRIDPQSLDSIIYHALGTSD